MRSSLHPPRVLRAFVATIGLALAGAAQSDTIVLSNGDRLTGKVSRLRGGKLEFETVHAGTLFIDAGSLVSVETEQPVTVILKDQSRVIGRLVGGDGSLRVAPSDGSPPRDVPTQRVAVLLPQVLTKDDWRFTGRIGLGVSDAAGNTEIRRIGTDDEVIAHRGRDRWALGLQANQSTENGDEAEANATVALKYDRFVSERWYALAGSSAEHDRRKGVRLRVTLGAGAGLQWIDTAATRLALEAGLDRVRTDYFRVEDDLSWAMQVALRLTHWVVPDQLQVFLTAQTFVNLGDVRRTFYRSQSGLRLPLSRGLMLSALLDVDWDGDPPPGRHSLDRTISFTLGYKW